MEIRIYSNCNVYMCFFNKCILPQDRIDNINTNHFEALFMKIHHGHNIKHLREMLGMKQEAIAIGLDMTQQAVSKLEQKEIIEDEVLEKVAKILDIPVDAIKKLNENSTVSYINTFNNSDNAAYNFQYYNFNPIEKIVELYERMLKIEQEKNEVLEQLLKEKKNNP